MGLKRLKKGYFGVWGLPLAQAEMTNTEARVPPSDTQFTEPPKNAKIFNLSQLPAFSLCKAAAPSPCPELKGLPPSLAKVFGCRIPSPPSPRTARSPCAILPAVSDPAPGQQPPAANRPPPPQSLGLRLEVENNDPYCD